MQKYHVLTITGWGMTIGGAVMLLIFRPWHIQGVQFSGKLWLLLACVIVLGTVLSFSLFQSRVQHCGQPGGQRPVLH